MRSSTDAIALIKNALKDAKDEQANKSSCHNERYLNGRVSGLETALYFLGDPETVKVHDAFIAKIMEEHNGETA